MLTEVKVRIRGISPLMMNRRPPEGESEKVKKKGQVIDPTTDAMRKAHHDPEIGFFIPGVMLEAAFREAGKNVKKGRGSAKKTVTYSVTVQEDKVPLNRMDYDAIDTRYGTHPSTGMSVPVSRVRFDKWSLEFTLLVNEDRLDLNTVEFLIKEAGDVCGIGSYKPANPNGGKFGRWKLDLFEVQKKIEE